MTEPDYKQIYYELSARHGELSQLRDDLELRLGETKAQIKGLKQTLDHLAPLAGFSFAVGSNISELGITNAVRTVLDPNEKMSVSDVRERMEERGFDFSEYTAPDASVRTILNRLVEGKPPRAKIEKEGYKTFYFGMEISDEDIPF